MKVFFLIALTIAAAGNTSAADPAQLDVRLEAAKARYYEAVQGDRAALEQAGELFTKLHAEYPEHPVIMAYTGSTQLLEAAKTIAPWRKGKLSKQGLAVLDGAVARAPEDLEVRFVRAASTFHLPGLFHRREQSRSDFEWLAPRVTSAVETGALDRRLAAAALYHHGLFREKSGDRSAARSAWEEAVRIGGDTHAGADARKRLKQSE